MKFSGCSLCLKTIAPDFVVLEESHKIMLQIILPKMDCNDVLNGDSKMCQKCSENLQATYLFKNSCLTNNTKIELLEDLGETFAVETQTCRLCCHETIFENLKGRFDLQEMMNRCFPQLGWPLDDLNICEICLGSLKDLDSFISSCLKAEEHIRNHSSTMGIDCKDFNLNEYIQQKIRSTISVENEEKKAVAFKLERIEPTVLENNFNFEEPNEMDLPQEYVTFQDINNLETESSVQQVSSDNSGQGKKSRKTSQLSEKFRCDKCDYTTKYKSCLVSHSIRHKDPSQIKMHKCEECGHETKRIADLKWHMIIHKDPTEITMYQCAHCPHKSKRKADLKQHVAIHRSRTFKCGLCDYQTKHKTYLDTIHMLTHKDISEVRTFKCEQCSYQTKYKQHLKTHYLVHNDPSESKKYKCNWCNFETNFKQSIRLHQLIHKCKSELPLYKCDYCDYVGIRKRDLSNHMERHVVSDVTYQCGVCPYKAKRKGFLKKHMDLHRDPSEITMYKCDLCSYETKRKGNLKGHLYTHVKKLKASENKEKEAEDLLSKIHTMFETTKSRRQF